MGSANKREPSSSLPAWLLTPGLIVVVVAIACGGLYLAWRWAAPRVLNSAEYRVGPEQIELTPLPEWIHSDVRDDVFRNGGLRGPLSVTDADLVKRVRQAFSSHPWVAEVGAISKRYPAHVKVELVYRRPACMVEVPGGLWPVDQMGFLLPSEDFSALEALRYPRLVGVDQKAPGPAGQRWNDGRVIGGAEIAAALGKVWETLRLERIQPLRSDPADRGTVNDRGPSLAPLFALLTRGGTRILWGYAPGENAAGELPAAEKVARLQKYFADHDTLDAPGGRPQELDVRTLPHSAGR